MTSRFLFVTAALLAAAQALPASPSTVRTSEWVDVYHAWNHNDPTGARSFYPGAGSTASRDGGPRLNLAALHLESEPNPLGFELLLNMGGATDVIHAVESGGGGTDLDRYRGVTLANLSWRPRRSRWRLKAGTFSNPAGYEVFASKDNWSYTRSWMAELSPFFLTGAQAIWEGEHGWQARLMAVNGWQQVQDNNGAATWGLQLARYTERLSASWSTLVGPELAGDEASNRVYHDFVLTARLHERLDLALTYDVAHEERPFAPEVSWYGAAAYARYRLRPRLWLAVRAEKFRDPSGAITGTGQVLRERTLTLEHRPRSNLILKLETRQDTSTASVFRGADLVPGTPSLLPAQDLVVLGITALF